MHMTVMYQNVTEPQATENKKKVTSTEAPWVRQQRQTAWTDCHVVMSITL